MASNIRSGESSKRDRSIFPYPGGKSTLAPWIVGHLPKHTCYCEVFGGSASVLLTKQPSRIEVYNDLDGDLVHFFKTFREKTDELVEFLRQTPYARDLHSEWANLYYQGYRPVDDIERAARFFYLRYSQFASKYNGKSGFRSLKQRSPAEQLAKAREHLQTFAERFDHVQIENMDYRRVFERFDGAETVFYCDPPYMEEGDELYSHEGEFDHFQFVGALQDLEADWIVSYTDVPTDLEDYWIAEREVQYSSQNGKDGSHKSATERLVMNFDPAERTLFAGPEQQTIDEVIA